MAMRSDACLWHKADIQLSLIDVRLDLLPCNLTP